MAMDFPANPSIDIPIKRLPLVVQPLTRPTALELRETGPPLSPPMQNELELLSMARYVWVSFGTQLAYSVLEFKVPHP